MSRVTDRLARKPHTCNYCDGRIEIGEKHREGFILPYDHAEGIAAPYRAHALCEAFWLEVVGPEDGELYDWDEAKREHGWDEWLAGRLALPVVVDPREEGRA